MADKEAVAELERLYKSLRDAEVNWLSDEEMKGPVKIWSGRVDPGRLEKWRGISSKK